MSKPVTITVELTEAQALALAQMFKRQTWSCWRELSVDEAEAYEMRAACERVRDALAEKGVAPR